MQHDIDKGIPNITPMPENKDKFENLLRRTSHKNIPRTEYNVGLNHQTKEMYEEYLRHFTEDPFSKDTSYTM